MTSSSQATALFSVVSAAMLWYIVSSAWVSYRTAALRQDLFDVRDNLFDIALRHRALFEHPSYRLLRNRINSLIRFAHKFTTTRLLIVVVLMRKQKMAASEDWKKDLTSLPRELQESLDRVHKQLAFRIACHLLHVPMPVMWKVLSFLTRTNREAAVAAKIKMTEHVELLEEQALEETEAENCKFAMAR